ncbi:MAG: HAMP domain-containing histidine kinase [Atopobium sp.]|nr:HAMP domain-containing histidine kinase [Atopobium sp.]
MSSEKYSQSTSQEHKKPFFTPSDSSTAGVITWGFWWRKLMNYVGFNLFLLVIIALVFIYTYNQHVPQGTFYLGFFPTETHSISFIGFTFLHGLPSLKYLVHGPTFGAKIFDLGVDLARFWPLYIAILIWETIDLLSFFGDMRRVRRALQPLNTLALKADQLVNADVLAADKTTSDTLVKSEKIRSLEQAIEEANINAPKIQTGDQDLASIEIALNKLLRRMQEAKLQQMRFVNDASHELRTPIAVIRGYTDMLDRWGKTDEAVLDESIAALKSESEHMHDLVEQLLFLARGDAGRNTLTKTQFNLARITSEVCEESEMIDSSHRYTLKYDQSALTDNRYQVLADAAMIKQSIRIIVQNAARYSAAQTTISFNVSCDENTVQISVEDEGMGMSEAAATHIFERFWRADNARIESNEGSGLGLSIAKWIVDNHDGSIEVLSHEGVGTRFTIVLPRMD